MSEQTANPPFATLLDGQDEKSQLAGLPRNIAAHLQSLRTNMQTRAETKAEATADLSCLWEALSLRLQVQIGAATFRRWFEPITVTLSADKPFCLRLAFPTRFKRDWIEQHHGDTIRAYWHGMEPGGNIELAIMPQTKMAGGKPKSQVVQLPLWPDPVRGIPNPIMRSSLFAAIQGNQRRVMQREILEVQQGTEIRFTGIQLDQSDLDVWEQTLHLARLQPLGTRCHFVAHSFLKALGRRTGKSDHEWLKDSIARLAACCVEVKYGRFTYGGSLLEFYRDDETGRYCLEINQKMQALYDAGYTMTDWEQRTALRGKPLALWLHSYFATHAEPFPVKVETLHRLSGSVNKEMRSFKQKLKTALADVQAVGAIEGYVIDGELVSIERTPSPSQQRHLIHKVTRNRKQKP